jgi:CRP/FNR family transcriptional regulator/CRP/FNR family cyclic AMP-dependent transcriptional regulator
MNGDKNLARVPFLAELGGAELEPLAAACRARRFRRGEVLFHESDPGNALFLLLSGQVKILRVGEDGEERILHVLGPGEYLGELSLVDGAPRSATAQALEPVEAMALHREDFIALIERYPAVALAVMSGLAGMVRRLSDQVQDEALDAPGRIAKTLLNLALRYGETTPEGMRLTLRLTQQELAQMVGVTRVSVNKHLGWFQDRGILTVDRQGITIHKLEQLKGRIY